MLSEVVGRVSFLADLETRVPLLTHCYLSTLRNAPIDHSDMAE